MPISKHHHNPEDSVRPSRFLVRLRRNAEEFRAAWDLIPAQLVPLLCAILTIGTVVLANILGIDITDLLPFMQRNVR
jgi:hypothetical protein